MGHVLGFRRMSLACGQVLKVVHGCEILSDALWHQQHCHVCQFSVISVIMLTIFDYNFIYLLAIKGFLPQIP